MTLDSRHLTNDPVVALLGAERYGTLATISARREGWPFASIVAYATSEVGEPLLLLSALAEHTRNIAADPRASLLVVDQSAAADPLAGARVTLLGTVEALDNDAAEGARARYLERHSAAADYFAMADFALYVLRVTSARFVGGFGDMGWIDRKDLNLI